MKIINLSQNQFAKVDDWNYDELNQYNWLANWCEETKSYYAVRFEGKGVFRKLLRMHRVIAKTPTTLVCDHKDHDTLNNQEYNLRNVTRSQNSMNRRGASSRSQLGERCISWDGWGFRVRVRKEYKIVFNKSFLTLDDAKIARDLALRKYHGEFSCLQDKE